MSYTNEPIFKRRKVYTGEENVADNTMDSDIERPRKTSIKIVSGPAPQITIPIKILDAQTPQDLVHAILTANKAQYTKQELLVIIGKIDQMLQPKFTDPCPYIN